MSDEQLQKFSVVTTNGDVPGVNPLDQVLQEIERQKATYEKLLADHRELSKDTDQNVELTKRFQKRNAILRQILTEDEMEQAQGLELYKEDTRLCALQETEGRLKDEIQKMKEELCCMDKLTHELEKQTQVSTAMPEKRVVFTGSVSVAEASAGTSSSIDMKVRIMYPMEGGTALVTFEDAEVAQSIISMEQHEIRLGDCFIRVKAQPVQFLMPSHIEVDTRVCPRRILLSDLPKKVEMKRLLDRLEIHFQKGRNGGGEVETIDLLRDSGNVVITFAEDNVAKGLTDKKYHVVDNMYKLRVTPFVNGEITNLQTRMSVSQRTVLLTEIPDIMEQENMQDSLEIHFQKGGNGGGEVDAFIYNPLGHRTLAIFEEDSPRKK
ncbi:hypothetical protein COCON_G00032890 [Conger conger]|uniref:NID domain-containing protein n=1 Tax=Conger conger TaxID=82655 RepID=A0A9Q1DZK9_CONCO|nr:hypothetical protein COCON_G00032890 [Conger conger]